MRREKGREGGSDGEKREKGGLRRRQRERRERERSRRGQTEEDREEQAGKTREVRHDMPTQTPNEPPPGWVLGTYREQDYKETPKSRGRMA